MSTALCVRLGVCRKWWFASRCLLPVCLSMMSALPLHPEDSCGGMLAMLCTRHTADIAREPAAAAAPAAAVVLSSVLCNTCSREACSKLCMSPMHLIDSALSRTPGRLRAVCRFPVILFTLFNFADLAGKSIPMWGQHTSSHRTILQLALARILFVPAFAVAARLGVGPWWVCTLSVLLGVSNGYATALAMVAAPVGLQVASCPLAPDHLLWDCACCSCRALPTGKVQIEHGFSLHGVLRADTDATVHCVRYQGLAPLACMWIADRLWQSQGPVAAMAGQIVVFCLVLGLCFGAACGFLWLL